MNVPKLCLQTADVVERKALEGVVMPEATRSYAPVGHHTFLNLVEDKLADVGFRFGSTEHGLTKNGARYFGIVQLLGGGVGNEQHAMVMSIRNSLDKAFAAMIGFGAHVFVCENLCFSAEQVVGRKHTTNIMRDLPGLVVSCVSQTKAMSHVQDQRFEVYQDQKLTDNKADSLIIEMLRRKVINTQRVEKVVNEWYEPETNHGPKRAWRLFNAATEALKGSPIHEMPRRTIELQAIMDDVSAFTPQFEMAQAA
jgi:hypothetical protein